jgi:hypothetical protein
MLLGTMEDYGTSGTTTSPTVNYGIGNGTTEILVFPDAKGTMPIKNQDDVHNLTRGEKCLEKVLVSGSPSPSPN